MRWRGHRDDGTWTIPAEAREKGTRGELKLPEAALAIIASPAAARRQPLRLRRRRSVNGKEHACHERLGKRKRALDAKVAAELPDMPQWQLHDLRRTARSLMSRAGVPREHAERVMGHASAGRRGRLRSARLFRREGRRAGEARGADRAHRASSLRRGSSICAKLAKD